MFHFHVFLVPAVGCEGKTPEQIHVLGYFVTCSPPSKWTFILREYQKKQKTNMHFLPIPLEGPHAAFKDQTLAPSKQAGHFVQRMMEDP